MLAINSYILNFSLYGELCNEKKLIDVHFDSNPFALPIQPIENPSLQDWININNQVKTIDLMKIIDLLVSGGDMNGHKMNRKCLIYRMTRLPNYLIDSSEKIPPEKTLLKIGSGGENCIVCYVSVQQIYKDYLKNLISSLQTTGFNGHILYYIGGYPNPTGEEILYCAVPYSFKIFAIMDAYKAGFSKILWLDAALESVCDITPLFNRICKTGSIFAIRNYSSYERKSLLPRCVYSEILSLTGVDLSNLKNPYAQSTVFGLDMSTNLAQQFVATVYDFIRKGTPCCSPNSEEVMFTALLSSKPFRKWLVTSCYPIEKLICWDNPNCVVETAKKRGAYFAQRLKR